MIQHNHTNTWNNVFRENKSTGSKQACRKPPPPPKKETKKSFYWYYDVDQGYFSFVLVMTL